MKHNENTQTEQSKIKQNKNIKKTEQRVTWVIPIHLSILGDRGIEYSLSGLIFFN